MRYNVVQNRTKLGESCPFILTKNFFGKSTATFVRLLRPHKWQHLKNAFRKDHVKNVGVISGSIDWAY